MLRRRHGLNILKCKIKNRKYKRFAMKHPNDMVQMDILGPFYLHSSNQRNYIISCIDDCSIKVTSKWSERKRSTDVLDVLEEWIMINGKPNKVMHDNGKQFISKIFKHFLERNDMKDNKPIPNSYPQLQGKVEAYNKIVKNEFLSIEDIANSYDGRTRYERCLFVKSYNDTQESIWWNKRSYTI
jgi:transposase InsO family protein